MHSVLKCMLMQNALECTSHCLHMLFKEQGCLTRAPPGATLPELAQASVACLIMTQQTDQGQGSGK